MNYSSKLLLFGEYTVIKGSQALAMPFPYYSGGWAYAGEEEDASLLQQDLNSFAAYLDELKNEENLLSRIDIRLFQEAINNGLYFKSNIPGGYGLGSSGALCAAVYDHFATKKIRRDDEASFSRLKRDLAQLESFFHGSSSGIDPLICYLSKAVLIESDGRIKTVSLPPIIPDDEAALFLFDTGISRKTGPLVKLFLEKCRSADYEHGLLLELIPAVEHAIASLLAAHWELLFEKLHDISFFQQKYFAEMIPPAFEALWKKNLHSELYKLKLCGAGKGGFFLGFTKNFEKTLSVLHNFDLIKVF